MTATELKALAAETGATLKASARPSFVNDAMGLLEGIGGAVKQGFTFGFSDEAGALGAATGRWLGGLATGRDLDFGATYDQALKELRAPGKRFREQHPVTATVSEVAGGIVSGIPSAAITGGQSLLRTIVTGSGMGAVAGVGFSEGDLAERATGGAIGAVGGGVASAVLGATIRGIAAIGQRALTRTERTALNSTLRAFERDGVKLDDAMARLRQWRAEGAKPEMLADLGGDNVRGLLRAAISVPGDARTVAQSTLIARQANQGERVFADALQALAPGQNVRTVAKALEQARKAAADPLYEAARAAPLRMRGATYSVNDLLALLQRPTMKEAVKIATRQAADLGKPLPLIMDEAGTVRQIPDLEVLDWIKRSGLDSVIERFRDKTTGRLSMADPEVRAAMGLKNQFLAIVDDLSPAYRAARQAHAGPSESLNAIDMGRRFLADFKRDPFMTEETFSRMTAGEREFFRVGLAQSIQDTIEKAADGADAVKRIFGSARLREAIRLAMPSDKALQRFERAVDREANMFRTQRMAGLSSGSPTQRIGEEILDLTADTGIDAGPALSVMRGDVAGAALGVAGRLWRSLSDRSRQAMKADIAGAIGRLLMAGEPEEIARLLIRLQRASGAKLATGTASATAARAAGIASGAAAGELTE